MKTLEWLDGNLCLIDQTRLPHYKEVIRCENYRDTARAIKEMKVRGAPAIGVTAAYGIVLGVNEIKTSDKELFFQELQSIAKTLKETRPTAVNLFWAVDRMLETARKNESKPIEEIKEILESEAGKMASEDVDTNRKIGYNGEKLIDHGDAILTHCNAGTLATVGYGTALGVIRAAHEMKKQIEVFADETRPYLQGARLTVYELMQDEIPVTLLTDNMAGHFMRKKIIKKVIVGADRIAANGDVANKIGTYGVAVLAKENHIPFYVAAPISTIDLSLKNGEEIPIEERDPREVTHIGDIRIAPEGVRVANPAFDITPNRYITAIITEKGVIYPPYSNTLKDIVLKNK